MGKEKENLPKIEEIIGGKAHTNIWKLIRNFNDHRFLSQSEESKCMCVCVSLSSGDLFKFW